MLQGSNECFFSAVHFLYGKTASWWEVKDYLNSFLQGWSWVCADVTGKVPLWCLSLEVLGESADMPVWLPWSCRLELPLLAGLAGGWICPWDPAFVKWEGLSSWELQCCIPCCSPAFPVVFLQVLKLLPCLLGLLQPRLHMARSPRQQTAAGTHFMNLSCLEIVSKLFL